MKLLSGWRVKMVLLKSRYSVDVYKRQEQMKCLAWDSYNALSDHLNTEEKQREFANNYWEHVHRLSLIHISKMGKGITLSNEEFQVLVDAFKN